MLLTLIITKVVGTKEVCAETTVDLDAIKNDPGHKDYLWAEVADMMRILNEETRQSSGKSGQLK